MQQRELNNQSDENMYNSGLFSNERYGDFVLINQSFDECSLSRNKLLERRVEETLYNYTMWKANLEHI